jgi:integrase
VTIPVPSSLIAIIEATPRQGKTYIESKSGKQYTKESFGNDFHDWVIAAGLKQLSAHGLRKLAATLLAEAGATEQEIMAAMGWNTTDMANHYTKSANRKNLAKAAFNKRDSLTK